MSHYFYIIYHDSLSIPVLGDLCFKINRFLFTDMTNIMKAQRKIQQESLTLQNENYKKNAYERPENFDRAGVQHLP